MLFNTTAFFAFLARMGEENLAKKDLIEALSRAGFDLQRAVAVKKEMLRAIDHLLERAKEAGVVREDAAVPEVLALVTAAFSAMDRYGGDARSRERMFTIVCDGLRPPRPQTTPSPSSHRGVYRRGRSSR